MHILMGQPLNPREAERKGWCTKRQRKLSIAQWRLRGAIVAYAGIARLH